VNPIPDPTAERIVIDALGGVLSGVPDDARIGIAYSGGLDSTVLLDAAVRVVGAGRCVALHVHHGLSPNADAWLAHCAATARSLGVAFDTACVSVDQTSGEGIEAAARDARYRALDTMALRTGVATLWLAHHADDQAETVLLQLLRGAGIAGLAAMARQRHDPGAAVPRVRPLLTLLRAQLERYAHARALCWVEDESNTDTRYARNALRHDVVPVLTAHFPGFREALARTARHAATAQRLLDDLAAIDLASIASDDERISLSRAALCALDDARATNALRAWIRSRGMPAPSAARLAQMLRQLREAAPGHVLRVDHAGQTLRLYRDVVCWEPATVGGASGESGPDELTWDGREVWHLPRWRGSFVFAPVDAGCEPTAGAWPDTVSEALLAGGALRARPRSGGERLRRSPDAPSRSLKNLFQEAGVPAWKRDLPLLYLDERLLCVPTIGVDGALAGGQMPGPRRRIEWRPDLSIADGARCV
jgi:tRNA(Ile)-lysidine synthase